MIKKIQRISNQCERDNRAAEIQKLTDELRKAQTKHTLAKLYEKVLDYGSELILRECKCVENPDADRLRNSIEEDPLIGKPSCLVKPEQHHPEETLRKNAQFLIESSRKLPDYSPALLSSMEGALKKNDYELVIELAVQHDGNQRLRTEHKSDRGKSRDQVKGEVDEVKRELSITCNWGALLDEILAEKPLEKTALGHCVSAMKALSGELTYDARSAAKGSLTRAIAMLDAS